MGKVKETNQSGADIGLIGYAKGVRSIFLDAQTGKAVFGANGKGQITIDPTNNTARIYSGNFVYRPNGTGTGMEIDLTTPQIRFGSGNFEVNKEGHITAKGGGSIAGWQITNTELYSPSPYTGRKLTLDSANTKIYSGLKTALDSNTVGFHLSPEGLGLVSSGGGKILMKTSSNTPVIYSNNHNSLNSSAVGFYLSQDGLSLRSNYTKNGSTVASSLIFSTTGEPEIYSNSKNSLTNTRIGFYLSGSGLSIGSKFYADNNGIMRLGNGAVAASGRYWTIDGGSESYIAYNTNASYLSTSDNVVSIGDSAPSSSVYLGTDGIRLGKKFAVDRSGNILAKYIKATGGTVGGWIISSNKLSATDGKMELKSNGTLKGGSSYSWSINSAGTATFNRIKADKGGTIGNCTISENGIYSSGWNINSDGSASFKNIKITGGSLNIGNGQAVINSNGSANFKNISVKGTINATSGTFKNCTIEGSCTIGGVRVDKDFVKNANIANSAVSTSKIANAAITTAKIANASITDAKIASLSANKITAGTLSADRISGGTLNIRNGNYYLKMGVATNNPEVSGLNIGSQGIKVNGNNYGQTVDSFNFISSIRSMTVTCSTRLRAVTRVRVTLKYGYRSMKFTSGILTSLADTSESQVTDSDG